MACERPRWSLQLVRRRPLPFGRDAQWEGTELRAHPPQTDREFKLRAEQFSRYAAPVDIARVALRTGLLAGAFD